jgi:trans-aconitate 2-methyltransferase
MRCFQGVPEHQAVMRRLVELLQEGGVFAAQMPDNTREPSHVPMEKVFATHGAAQMDLPSAESYYDLLRPFLAGLDSAEGNRLLEKYTAEIAIRYPPRFDGNVLLPFPRFFMVAVR